MSRHAFTWQYGEFIWSDNCASVGTRNQLPRCPSRYEAQTWYGKANIIVTESSTNISRTHLSTINTDAYDNSQTPQNWHYSNRCLPLSGRAQTVPPTTNVSDAIVRPLPAQICSSSAHSTCSSCQNSLNHAAKEKIFTTSLAYTIYHNYTIMTVDPICL